MLVTKRIPNEEDGDVIFWKRVPVFERHKGQKK